VLGFVYLKQEANQPGESFTGLAVTATVLLSVSAPSISAGPAINVYAKQVEGKDTDAPESQDTIRIPVRY
jgi:hypothetical protein